MRTSVSRAISFGVVPEATSAWKPEIAPQASVMNRNGNSSPLKIGPVPSTNRVSAGMWISGCRITIANASRNTTPSLTNVDR